MHSSETLWMEPYKYMIVLQTNLIGQLVSEALFSFLQQQYSFAIVGKSSVK